MNIAAGDRQITRIVCLNTEHESRPTIDGRGIADLANSINVETLNEWIAC